MVSSKRPAFGAAVLLLVLITCSSHHARAAANLDVTASGQQVGAPQMPPPEQATLPQTRSTTSIAQLIDQAESPKQAAKKFEPITHDANKELIDYGQDILASLDFVQTLKMADGRHRVDSMLAKDHNNEELHQYLVQLNQQYPEVTRLYSIGESVQGTKLWALELSEQPGKHELLKPQFRYVANMHGNEVVGRELLLHLARLLLENYKAALEEPPSEQAKASGPKFVKKLLRDTRIHLLPTLNPDGYARSEPGCTYESPSRRGRVNANNVDLNRNFPDKILGSQVDAHTQPETRAFIEWTRKEPFVLSANLHGGALLVSIPYDGASDKVKEKESRRAPDDDVFRQLASVYSTSHKTMALGNDCYDRCSDYHMDHQFPLGTIIGAEWYSIHGSLADWLYDFTSELDVTIELGCNQYPPSSVLPEYWDYNKKALINFIREVHKGVKGIVVDESGRPLGDVTVHVSDRDHDVKTNSYGEYYRILLPGTYDISFSHPDMVPQKAFINISHGGMAQIFNVSMTKKTHNSPSAPNSQFLDIDEFEHSDFIHDDSGGFVHTTNEDHSILVATLIMSVVTVAILILMAGAYVIQKRRFTRSQSVSVELQPRTTTTMTAGSKSTLGMPGGSSTNQTHLSA